MIESLSLIDAVMPDVVETRKQAVSKAAQIKTEPTNANGEEASSMSKTLTMVTLNDKGVCFLYLRTAVKNPLFIGILHVFQLCCTENGKKKTASSFGHSDFNMVNPFMPSFP